ncbi:DsbA family protein [Thermoproteus tenax]|uniref:Protein-disulfide isomerase n=1 Tax=Thermoproteus tenax (strain ATCC 35583 / DSM 2078 / JCM 9277 / NBRC 100435 / Kra 1) TaxID=768679 RepID=G4RN07_THETK|nr:thioredoxin domain-containing protein [Thermoproteus tenax]CCC80951.1 Protein-disulfide isomerase [Thermoproteus tenax Kra 1]
MNKWALIIAAVGVVIIAGAVAAIIAMGGQHQQNKHIAYFCAGATPAVFQAIHLAEAGALEGQIAYEGQTVCVGVQLAEGQYEYLLSLLNSSMRVGSGGVAVVEYLDPTCPYCALFYALYGGGLGSYVENGTVTLAVRYFPTHVFSYYQEGQYEAFDAGVEAWLYWQCAYRQGRLMEAVEGTYAVAARYIEDYLRTGNSTDLSVYPLAELSYLSQSLPGCHVNATTAQLAQLVQSALGQVSSEAQRMGVPQSMLGTPLFVVFRIK